MARRLIQVCLKNFFHFFLKKSAWVALTFPSLERTLEPLEMTTAVTSVTATLKESLGGDFQESIFSKLTNLRGFDRKQFALLCTRLNGV